MSPPIALTPLRARRARKTRGRTHAAVARARVHNYLNPVNIPTDKRAACAEGGSCGRIEGREGRDVGQLADRETGEDRGRGHFALALAKHYECQECALCSLYSPRDGTCFSPDRTATAITRYIRESGIARR